MIDGRASGKTVEELRDFNLWPAEHSPDLCAFTPVLAELSWSMRYFVNSGVRAGSPFKWNGVKLVVRSNYIDFI